MKRNKIYLFVIILLMLGMAFRPVLTIADSGFDSSWDSGGGGWDSGSDWDSGSSGGGATTEIPWYVYISWGGFVLILTIVVLYEICEAYIKNKILSKIIAILLIIFKISLFVLFAIKEYYFMCLIDMPLLVGLCLLTNAKVNEYYSHKKKMKERKRKAKEKQQLDKKMQRIVPNFNVEEFLDTAFNIYKDIQIAWMNFDLDTIRNLVSDEIYNMYSMQLETLKVKGQKNMMEDIVYDGGYISDIKIENNIETVKVVMNVECYDYLIDSNYKVIRGNKNLKNHYVYELTFTRDINGVKSDKCPNCGALLDINSSGLCKYCNSTIVNKESKWIMVKKEMINQWSK